MVEHPQWSYEWVLWVSVWCYGLHIIEEYFFNWKEWAKKIIGLQSSWQDFFLLNSCAMAMTIACAAIGWHCPLLALSMTAVWGVNAIFFHIGPTIVTRVWSPGTFTATILYLPCVALVYWGAHRDDVLTPVALWGSTLLGCILMFGLVLSVKFAKKLHQEST
ncbi:MAG: HXXEE domain-containing protein [Phycisphaerales bacterium]|jgi:hypothetical protein|nr:HXXEE domain-containing protein [Phycisphaerales bacterium]